MGRRSNREIETLEAIHSEFAQVSESPSPVLPRILPLLAGILSFDQALSYGVRREQEGYALSFGHTLGMPTGHVHAFNSFDRLLRATPQRWGAFNPDRPEPKQQNAAFAIAPAAEHLRELDRASAQVRFGHRTERDLRLARAGFERTDSFFRSIGLGASWQLRVLVCEGGSLLGWVGGFCSEQPRPRDCKLLQSLTPALRKRLAFERLLGRRGMVEQALIMALEEIHRPAFVIDARGGVQYANALGESQLASGALSCEALRDAAAGKWVADGFTVSRVRDNGLPPHFLVLAPSAAGPEQRLQLAARRWGLTPRQAETLARVVAGESTKDAALHLGCSERTLEAHLTTVMTKASASSRSALLAKFWTQL